MKNKNKGITLVSLTVTIIVLLILVGVAIGTLGGENGLFSKTKLAKKRYEISEAKEKLEFAITELRIEEEGNGDSLTKEDLIKLNNYKDDQNNKIDVKSTESFPVEIIFGKYKFSVDEQFIVTYIGEANETMITYTTTPEGYTNQDSIKLTIKISNPNGIRTVEFPDGGTVECFGKAEYAKDFSGIVNGTYTYKATDMEGNERIKEIIIDRIDKLEPKDFSISYEKTENGIKVIGEAEDAEADETSSKSGIDYYEYYLTNSNDETTKYDNREIEIKAGGTYKLYAVAHDKAGNTKRTSTIEIQIIKPAQIEAGNSHTFEIDSNGSLWAWGRNDLGQLGDGTTENKTSPVQIKKGTKFKQISSRVYSNLAIDSAGNLWAWGYNGYGQIGDGTTENKTSPVQIKKGTKFKQISAGYFHSLAIDESGNLWAWGNNEDGQLGDGTTTKRTTRPVQIKKGTKFSQVSAGSDHSLAIDESGNLWAWGNNGNGQIGDGTTENKTSPVQIKSETKFSQVFAGTGYSLAIDESGNLWAWGNNGNGQIGDETTENKTSPVQIKSGTKFSQVSAGYFHSLAIDTSGNLWAWGNNGNGQIGDGTTENKTSPVQIKSGTKFSQVSAGAYYSLAIDTSGNLWTWGNNGNGQLGDGTTEQRNTPIQIKN